MNSLNLLIRDDGGEDEMERVTEWLSMLTSKGETIKVEMEKVDPIMTPRRQYVQQQQYEEASPTNTRFSGTSIFDKAHRYEGLVDPSPQDCFRDIVSDVTSLTGDDCPDTPCKRPHKSIFKPDSLQAASLNSYDPDSEIEGQHIPEAYTPYPRKPNHTHLVTILSCMQCTLLSLPCSRTTPACTRCIRSAAPSTCLLLRRPFIGEIETSSMGSCPVPVLLKLRNEDPETWKQKMQVRKALVEQWQRRLNRANWVLPRIDKEKRGNYRVGGYVPLQPHLGEGWGRIRYEQLIVDGETFFS
jgi:hypothetical protein